MAYPLNNVTVNSDGYTDAATATFQVPVNSAVVSIFNQAVYMEVGVVQPGNRAQAAVALREEYKVPGVYTLRRSQAIGFVRFRRAVTGQDAQVSVV